MTYDPSDEQSPRHRSQKNRRKWCGGKKGRAHTPVWVCGESRMDSIFSDWLDLRCTRCGRNLNSGNLATLYCKAIARRSLWTKEQVRQHMLDVINNWQKDLNEAGDY